METKSQPLKTSWHGAADWGTCNGPELVSIRTVLQLQQRPTIGWCSVLILAGTEQTNNPRLKQYPVPPLRVQPPQATSDWGDTRPGQVVKSGQNMKHKGGDCRRPRSTAGGASCYLFGSKRSGLSDRPRSSTQDAVCPLTVCRRLDYPGLGFLCLCCCSWD